MKRTAWVVCLATIGAVAVLAPVSSAQAQDACRQGFVWREAFPGDYVCVTPETRAQAAQDNSQAASRRQPGGGAYGPNTCLPGFVWREARPDDLVCVTPETRAQAASDNAQTASRRVPSGSATAPPVTRPPGSPPIVAPPPGGYKSSQWSQWGRAQGVEYRYRWGLNPQEPKYANQVDATLQVKNPGSRVWEGLARLLDCSEDRVAMSKRVVLQPQETQEVKFLTPNCGTKDRPSVRPNIGRTVRID
jgi:hypothetical protein